MIRHQRDIIKNHLPLRRYLDNYEIMIDMIHFMLLNKGKHNIDSLSKDIHVSKTKLERAINLLKNQAFIKTSDSRFQEYELEDEISCCLKSREEIETLINRELTTPEEIMQTHTEALNPNHAAISLDGEPLLFPRISDLVKEFRTRDMTTFIVTNGTLPEVVSQIEHYPSQFYFTLAASNEQLYKKACRPMVRNGWSKIMDTMDLIESLPCRTLVRLTAVKDFNINEQFIKDYIKIVKKANPNFFEIKGFTLQAKALLIQDRLKSDKPVQDYFPSYEYLEEIALKFEEIGNFPLIYRNKPSRDFLFAVNWEKDRDPTIKSP